MCYCWKRGNSMKSSWKRFEEQWSSLRQRTNPLKKCWAIVSNSIKRLLQSTKFYETRGTKLWRVSRVFRAVGLQWRPHHANWYSSQPPLFLMQRSTVDKEMGCWPARWTLISCGGEGKYVIHTAGYQSTFVSYIVNCSQIGRGYSCPADWAGALSNRILASQPELPALRRRGYAGELDTCELQRRSHEYVICSRLRCSVATSYLAT